MSNGYLAMLQLVCLKFLHIWNSLDRKMNSLFVQSQPTNKIIVYVKNEGTNLNILVVALTYIVSCAPLQIASPFIGICFGHIMFKACQYVANETKVGVEMKEVSLMEVQNSFQKTITWMKKFGEKKARMGANLEGNWLVVNETTKHQSKQSLFPWLHCFKRCRIVL